MSGVANPVETVVGILQLLEQLREKMDGTELATVQWRPISPDMSERLTDLAFPALQRASDITEALVIVTIAALRAAGEEAENLKIDTRG